MTAFLATPLGRYLLIGAAIALAVGAVLLYVYRQGEAAAALAAAATGMAATAKANKARAGVKPNDKGAMDNDPFNRDRR